MGSGLYRGLLIWLRYIRPNSTKALTPLPALGKKYQLPSLWLFSTQSGIVSSRLALELQEELGSAGDDLAVLPPERIDQTVITNIYGGHVVIAGRVEDVMQAGSVVVIKGDLASLNEALARLGAAKSDVRALEEAIAEDAAAPASPGLGHRTLGWIQSAAIKLARKGGDAALDVAKAEVTAELTKLVSQFLGLA